VTYLAFDWNSKKKTRSYRAHGSRLASLYHTGKNITGFLKIVICIEVNVGVSYGFFLAAFQIVL